jgi:hypothetical protein
MPDRVQERAFEKAHQALLYAGRLLSQYGLSGVGVGLKVKGGRTTDEPCVKAFVSKKIPLELIAPGRAVPPALASSEGAVRTDVEEMLPPTSPPWLLNGGGEREAYWIGNRLRHRPLSGGDSISHFRAPLGTVATAVLNRARPSERAILSCNHVLAALNRGIYGDPIVQPATGDGGFVPKDTCGFLERWVPIRFGVAGPNLVDAAIAWVGDQGSLPWVDWIGLPGGVLSGNSMRPGDHVLKVGRTTGLTTGSVVAVHVHGWLSYPDVLGGGGAAALFREQIVTTGMAGFGDSGSLLFDNKYNAVGLLFGGSPSHTFFNDITHVQRELDILISTYG